MDRAICSDSIPPMSDSAAINRQYNRQSVWLNIRRSPRCLSVPFGTPGSLQGITGSILRPITLYESPQSRQR